MRTIGLIPARGGSKRLPGKNIRYMHGKHLICWSIEAALKSKLDAVYVTTEDPDIKRICSRYEGLHVIDRPDALAVDLTHMRDVIWHATTLVHCDRVMLLQPTSPLRTTADINAALEFGRPCASVYRKARTEYVVNGAIFLMDRLDILPWDAYPFPLMSQEDSIDIDHLDQFEAAEARMRELWTH